MPPSKKGHPLRVLERASALVTVSFGLTCGHSQPPSKPLPSIDAASHPGQVLICDRCDEYAMVDRITIRLVPDPKVLTRLMALGGEMEEHFATEILSRQGKIR